MDKKKLAALVLLLVIVGVGTWFFVSKKSQSKSVADTVQNQTTNSETESSGQFNPLSTSDLSFVATMTADADGVTSQSVMKYDKNTKNYEYSVKSDQGTMRIVYTSEAYYLCRENEQCIKYLNSEFPGGFDKEDFEYTEDEINSYRNTSTYDGKKNCASGTCDVWKVNTNGYESSIYIDSKTKRIVQAESRMQSGSSKIVYEYKDVTIDVPANAQMLNL